MQSTLVWSGFRGYRSKMILARVSAGMGEQEVPSCVACRTAVYYTGYSQDTCFNQMRVNSFSWPSSLFLSVLVFTYNQ